MAVVATAIAIVLAMNCAPTTARKVIFNENLISTVHLFYAHSKIRNPFNQNSLKTFHDIVELG